MPILAQGPRAGDPRITAQSGWEKLKGWLGDLGSAVAKNPVVQLPLAAMSMPQEAGVDIVSKLTGANPEQLTQNLDLMSQMMPTPLTVNTIPSKFIRPRIELTRAKLRR